MLSLDPAQTAYLRGLLPAADFAQPGMVPPQATSGRLDGGDGHDGLLAFQFQPIQMAPTLVRSEAEWEGCSWPKPSKRTPIGWKG